MCDITKRERAALELENLAAAIRSNTVQALSAAYTETRGLVIQELKAKPVKAEPCIETA